MLLCYVGMYGTHKDVYCEQNTCEKRQSQHNTVHSINGSGHTIEVMCMYNTFQCKPVLYWVV